MSSQVLEQFFYTQIKEAVLLEGNFVVGSAGAVGTVKGGGIASVELLAAGIYRINFDVMYNRRLNGTAGAIGCQSGSDVADGSLTPGSLYVITAVGTSDFTLNGAAVNQVGEAFVPAAAGGAGTGKAKLLVPTNVCAIQSASQNPDMCNHTVMMTLDKEGALVAPTAGTVIAFTSLMRRSAVKGQGES
jgi:hypothetical protein